MECKGNFSDALELAVTAHRHKTDKVGMPYIFHPVFVASQFEDETLQIIALLHDVVEDTWIRPEDLERYRFSHRVIDAVDAITRWEMVETDDYESVVHKEPYTDYIKRCALNPDAKLVKLADLKHNLSRQSELSENKRSLSSRYKWALRYLEGIP